MDSSDSRILDLICALGQLRTATLEGSEDEKARSLRELLERTVIDLATYEVTSRFPLVPCKLRHLA